ncbi:MAG: 30S ribosomal protein S6 [Patescibacteria group bacterium]
MIEEQNQKHYEMLTIIPAQYTDDEMPGVINKIKGILAEHNGRITLEENLGKKKLSYAIKQVFHGYYWLCEFNLLPEELKKLHGSLKLAPEVLRYLIVAKHEKTAEEKIAEKERKDRELKVIEDKLKAEIVAEEKVDKKEEEKKEAEKPGKVSLEDLDKKLDELIDDSIL